MRKIYACLLNLWFTWIWSITTRTLIRKVRSQDNIYKVFLLDQLVCRDYHQCFEQLVVERRRVTKQQQTKLPTLEMYRSCQCCSYLDFVDLALENKSIFQLRKKNLKIIKSIYLTSISKTFSVSTCCLSISKHVCQTSHGTFMIHLKHIL